MASEAENKEINQLIDELEDEIVMTMGTTCSPDEIVVKKTTDEGGEKEDNSITNRTPSFQEEPIPNAKAAAVSSMDNVLPQRSNDMPATMLDESTDETNARPPAAVKDDNTLATPTVDVEEEIPLSLMEESNWDDVREFEIKTRRLAVQYTGHKNDDEDFDDVWPRWHWSRGRRRRRPRPLDGWYDLRVAPPRPRKVENLRYIHKEVPQTKLDTRKGFYSVVLQVEPLTTLPQFGFYQGKLRFLGNPNTYPHVSEGELRKRFDVVCSIDGQSVLFKSMAFILTQLVSPPDVTTRTLRLRPFERMVELGTVPDEAGEILKDEMEVIEIEDNDEDDESVEIVMENVSEELSPSAVNDDDDAVYSSDDDSYEREIKAGIRAKPKPLSDDLSSRGDDDSDYVMDDVHNNPEADMDLDLGTLQGDMHFNSLQGAPPKQVTIGNKAPKLKAPPERQPPPQAAANLYAKQMQQQQSKVHSQQPQGSRLQNGSTPPMQQQLSFYRRNNPVFMAPSDGMKNGPQLNPEYMAPNNTLPPSNGIHTGQPMPSARDYTVVLPVTPRGLGIRICESRGRVIFIGFADNFQPHPAMNAFHKVGDAIVAVDGVSVENATPELITNFLKQNQGKQRRVLIMRTGWTDSVIRTVPNENNEKYSRARVRERMNSDGTVAPASLPRLTRQGSFVRPAGRARNGMEWDTAKGIWVPEKFYG